MSRASSGGVFLSFQAQVLNILRRLCKCSNCLPSYPVSCSVLLFCTAPHAARICRSKGTLQRFSAKRIVMPWPMFPALTRISILGINQKARWSCHRQAETCQGGQRCWRTPFKRLTCCHTRGYAAATALRTAILAFVRVASRTTRVASLYSPQNS